MADWRTDEIKAAIEAMPLVKEVEVYGPGGDYDTSELIVDIEDATHRLYVCGFGSHEKTIEELGATSDYVPNCEYVSLRDGLDSRGGLVSDQLNVGIVYAHINAYLQKRGFNVIRHYKEIF